MEDAILTGVEPNVLFFLDDSTTMTMSMKGQMPVFLSFTDSVMQNSWPIMRDANFRAELLKDLTYGTGTRTVSEGTTTAQAARLDNNGLTLPFVSPHLGTERTGFLNNTNIASERVGYTRWGRDLDAANNIIGDPDCYYSPDPYKPYVLTFRNRTFAEWDGTGSLPAGFPADLASYLPEGAKAGEPVPLDLADIHLVPNDSKMYKMKLVLWRILSRENAEMLSKLRLGVATTFGDHLWGVVARSPTIRRPPFRRNEAAQLHNFYKGNNSDEFWASHNGTPQWIHFPHGAAPNGYSGIYPGSHNDAVEYDSTEGVYSGVVNNYYQNGPNAERHAERAMLRVPFDFMYSLNPDGTYRPSASLISFRELIDGIEQMDFGNNVNVNDRFANDELQPSSLPNLSRLFYGHDGYHVSNGVNQPVLNNQKAVAYAQGANNTQTQHTGIFESLNYTGWHSSVTMKRFRNIEGLMTGTALGTFLDFFAPLNSNILPFTTAPEANDTRGYFPVTGSCQPNWVIVFTGGDDRESGDGVQQSLLKLYENSKEMRGRYWSGTEWIEKTHVMDDPIRTIFVGMMSTESADLDGDPYADDAATDSSAKRVRKAVRRMAHAGQPHPDGTLNTDIEPYFADNTADLLNALQSILLQIRTERFAGGAPVILDPYEDEGTANRALFSASYEVHMLRQWGSSFARYSLPDDPDADSTLVWEAEKLMYDRRDTREIYTSRGTAETSDAAVDGLRTMDDSTFASRAGVPEADGARFKDWLFGYSGEVGILGDMEHSGVTIVDNDDDTPPGIPNRERRIYLQTNRGVLHSLKYETGVEAWAFIPPNIFQNRIRDQKFLLGATWIEGDGYSMLASRPLVLLDGMLAPNDITVDGLARTYMVGALGWGGNGFYAMDVTSAGATPNFLWAIDNARYAETEPKPLDGVKRWGAAAAGNKNDYDYSDLGLTIVAPEFRVTKNADVGILPGGLGYNFGADSHGKAFYVFEPKNGRIIKKIGTGNGYVGPGTMGMGITPVTYVTSGKDGDGTIKTLRFFTGDSEGNVLYCDTTAKPADWELKSVFRLRTAEDKPVALTKALEIGKVNDASNDGEKTRWIFGGTADLMVPDFSEERGLRNDEQYIFGLNLTRAMAEPSPASVSDLVRLKYMKTNPDFIPSYGEEGAQAEVLPGARGWALKLRPKLPHDTLPTDAEYVTASPFLYGGVVYVGTFIPRTRHPDDQEQCRDLGDGKLYALDPLTGASKWKGNEQALLFNNIKIVGLSASKGKLFIGIKALSPGALDDLKASKKFDFRSHGKGAILELSAADIPTVTKTSLEPEVPHLQYWREVF
jgi:hypothetical protein